MTNSGWRIGCDIGGTFTDFFAIDADGKRIVAEKRLTTPDDPSRAVIEGLQALHSRMPGGLGAASTFIHGTTLVINALIQRKGARTGLLATRGFIDVPEMRREVRYDSYDLQADFPMPLVERPDRLPVHERVLADGSVHESLDETHALAQYRRLRDAGVEAVAVCLLHSYANPVHEQRLRDLILAEDPGAFVSLSSDVLPEIREFERMTAVTANAYVQPLVSQYLDRMLARLSQAGFGGRVHLMLSNGGLSSVATARAFPIRIVESGPAAGAMAAEHFSGALGLPDLLSFDMGGTTAKSVLVKDGRVSISNNCEVARVHRFKKGSGLPLKLPFVDLLEIGAGGGSIVQINQMGLIQVGPESASSVPGPACYGRGGQQPTVTDANLILGYLNADYFLGGEMRLDRAAARKAIEEHVCEPMNMGLLEAAWGVHDIVNENMASAAKIHLAEKGEAPQRLAMIAFGGAGPLHAAGLARKLGIGTVVVPPWAGVLSALGFFAAPVSFDVTATYKTALDVLDIAHLATLLAGMRAEVARFLGTDEASIAFETELELRYAGQGFEVPVRLPHGAVGIDSVEQLRRLFEETYLRLYGRVYSDIGLELMNLHVTGRLDTAALALPPVSAGGDLSQARKGSRPAYSHVARALVPHDVFERRLLPVGAEISGPAIVEERECTTIVAPDMRCSVHPSGALIIDAARA